MNRMTKSSPTLSRAQWLDRLFPDRIPRLWCPPITHYDSSGAIDAERMAAHWKFLSPWVKGLLVPGSTGDGWELTAAESRRVLGLGLDLSRSLNLRLLVGALRPVAADAQAAIADALSSLPASHDGAEMAANLERSNVCGFAICPPRGQTLTQPDLAEALTAILDTGVPTALYQLPQVTQNEMDGPLVATLSRRFPNFILFKDTSGTDKVTTADPDLGGVFLVRGAEGAYVDMLKSGGGTYDGFLLSTANSFCQSLAQIINDLDSGKAERARQLSQKLAALVEELFRLVGSVPDGNVFANAAKAADHFFAFGPGADAVAPPRLHAGRPLPTDIIRQTRTILNRYGMLPQKGYLE
jgi:dihydrodipicolinate synthase/N-acetylneuraminate lyase